MVDEHNFFIDYWEDKKPKLRKITVPMYATASYSTGLHTEGSVRGFALSSSKEKWYVIVPNICEIGAHTGTTRLRWTPTQEWHDIYQQENINDLQKFLDKYMRGIDNGWENTPKIRLSLLGYNRPSVIDRPESSYPPPSFQPVTFYLDAANASLTETAPKEDSKASYQADAFPQAGLMFSHRFDSYTELCGFSRLKIFMSTTESDDMVRSYLAASQGSRVTDYRMYTSFFGSWIKMAKPCCIKTYP